MENFNYDWGIFVLLFYLKDGTFSYLCFQDKLNIDLYAAITNS